MVGNGGTQQDGVICRTIRDAAIYLVRSAGVKLATKFVMSELIDVATTVHAASPSITSARHDVCVTDIATGVHDAVSTTVSNDFFAFVDSLFVFANNFLNAAEDDWPGVALGKAWRDWLMPLSCK